MKCILSILLVTLLMNPIVTRHDKEEKAFFIQSADYPEVVQLRLKDLTGLVEMEGTLIKKDWILTAAHGLNSVQANQHIKLFDSVFSIQAIWIHPEFEGFENDIALIHLDRPVSTIQPISLATEKNEMGKQITLLGRGWSGTGLTGPIHDDKKLRIATNKVDSVSNHWIKFRFDEPDHPNTTELEGISGPGDSGGPALIEINGKKYLAGISSNQLNEQIGIREGHYGVIEYYTRVSSYLEWINGVINGFIVPDEAKFNTTIWGFPDTEIGKKANQFMDAIASKKVSEEFMKQVFYKSFRESFDLQGFVQNMSNTLENPKLGEVLKAKNNLLIFTVNSENQIYLIQLEADKRDDYLIGGLIFKKQEN